MLKNFFKQINNLRISNVHAVTPPIGVIKQFPVSESEAQFIVKAREQIIDVLEGRDKRLMVIVGPCSIHDPASAREYANRLATLRDELAEDLLIVMRVYFEKPRTTIGWKGLIYDPDLDNSFDIEKGLLLGRELLLDITRLKLPVAVEYLDLLTPQYFSDLVSWGAIGARTTESQTHRELASGLSCPVGFKNGTNGSIDIAVDAVISASHPHMFWGISKKGVANRYQTSGNANCHVILRGGKTPNYDKDSVEQAITKLTSKNLATKVMIDFSHGNSQKQHKNQLNVGQDIIKQLKSGSENIFAVMIESHLQEGNQNIDVLANLQYGKSITDACLGWQDSEQLLRDLAAAVRVKNQSVKPTN